MLPIRFPSEIVVDTYQLSSGCCMTYAEKATMRTRTSVPGMGHSADTIRFRNRCACFRRPLNKCLGLYRDLGMRMVMPSWSMLNSGLEGGRA